MSYLRERRRVVPQFKKQLLEIFDDNSDNLIECFRMYLAFLRKYAHRELTEFEQFQLDDMEMSIYNTKFDTRKVALETAWLYSRRGGKTRGLSILANFFSLLNKDVAWRAPHGEQLKKAGYWYSLNPFTKRVMLKTDNTIRVFGSPSINIAPMTTGRVTGGDCDVLILDEGGWIRKDLQAYQMYLTCRPMVSTSDFKHIINASTPARDTAFQDEWDSIDKAEKKHDTKLTSTHNCDDCHWISPEWIESESAKYPKWYIEMNYYCLWTVPYGAVFEKIILVGSAHQKDKYPQFDSEFLYKIQAKRCGVDHNGGDKNNPHYLVTGHYDDNFVYVLDEYTFTNLHFLFDKRFEYLSMEIEDGLFNNQFTEQEKRMGVKAIYQEFSEDLKMERVQDIRNRWIIIDKERASLTYQNILNAAYDKKSRLVKLEKRTDQHGIDCVIHFMHPEGGEVSYKRMPKRISGRVFTGDGWN